MSNKLSIGKKGSGRKWITRDETVILLCLAIEMFGFAARYGARPVRMLALLCCSEG
jgi:hypothetical protein